MGLEGLDEETKSILKSRLMPVLSRNIKTQYRYGANHITISASKKKINKLLSMAAPGVPGSNLIMLASLLPMLGIPPEAAQLSICISAFVGMILVPANCTGDAVVAMLIHKGELKKSAQ